ncbi:MAG: polymer-forming cytoskeletal protein [Saprospirales bacterium]|nr:polymer-forming cytoskeletal protein [Saprospirales bacterium]MBK8921676.1 polymer-forming cytoskeletal protein [Saprospirales bacterium]
MFGSNKSTEEPKSAAASSAPNALNTLVKGTVVEGTLRCDNDLRVDGVIKGKLHCKSKVIIGPTGSVEGEIHCQNAVIEGRFKGILQVSELLNVRETAEIEGDITTNKLLVQSGARFNVTCKMEAGAANGAIRNADVKAENNAAAATAKVAGGKEEIRN